MNVIGEVKGKNCILIDDMIDTAGTITTGANALIDLGANSIFAACSHGVFSGPAIQRIQDSAIEELLTLNTLVIPEEKQIDKIKILSTGTLFGRAIDYVHFGRSLSKLFVGRYA